MTGQGREEWRPVQGWEGRYEVSDYGRVRSLVGAEPHILSAPPCVAGGYPTTHLTKGRSISRTVKVHRLVLAAFVGPCPVGMEGCHNDGDPTNNHLSNLRWDTRSANMRDKVLHGNHHNANRTVCVNGHEFTTENTYLRPDGQTGKSIGRSCRECGRAAARRYKDRRTGRAA